MISSSVRIMCWWSSRDECRHITTINSRIILTIIIIIIIWLFGCVGLIAGLPEIFNYGQFDCYEHKTEWNFPVYATQDRSAARNTFCCSAQSNIRAAHSVSSRFTIRSGACSGDKAWIWKKNKTTNRTLNINGTRQNHYYYYVHTWQVQYRKLKREHLWVTSLWNVNVRAKRIVRNRLKLSEAAVFFFLLFVAFQNIQNTRNRK